MKLKSEAITAFFEAEKIEHFSAIPADKLRIIQPQKLTFMGFDPRSAIVICVPYFYPDEKESNLSMYARSKDYHLYFKELFVRLGRLLTDLYPGLVFRGYADSSPFDERSAAESAGLGYVGDHGLLICEPYGSYVFIGMMLGDLPYAMLADEVPKKLCKECLHCGACKKCCPSPDACLSSLTQKKGELSKDEIDLILRGKLIWGCDSCQECCPLNREIKVSPIAFFSKDRIGVLTRDMLCNMPDEQFLARAFAWRKRETILRNIKLFETHKGY